MDTTEQAQFWAGMLLEDRVSAIRASGADVSVFAARRSTLPDSPALLAWLGEHEEV